MKGKGQIGLFIQENQKIKMKVKVQIGLLVQENQRKDNNTTQSVKGICFHQVNFEIRKSYGMHFEDLTHFIVWLIAVISLHIVRSGPLLYIC